LLCWNVSDTVVGFGTSWNGQSGRCASASDGDINGGEGDLSFLPFDVELFVSSVPFGINVDDSSNIG